MAIEIFDLVKIAHEEAKRKVVFKTPRIHAWGPRVLQSRRQR